MRILALLLILVAGPAFAQDSPLVGTWKLIAFQSVVDGEPPKDAMGPDPKGHLIMSREGRMISIITTSSRKPGNEDAERAALHKSMLSYSGRYRVDGDVFATSIDASWNEAWSGTEQKRFFRLEGDKLFIETGRQPSVIFPGKMAIGRLVWQREN